VEVGAEEVGEEVGEGETRGVVKEVVGVAVVGEVEVVVEAEVEKYLGGWVEAGEEGAAVVVGVGAAAVVLVVLADWAEVQVVPFEEDARSVHGSKNNNLTIGLP
jgi:hypothetical protein